MLVWKFDRFARSTRHLLTALEEFDHLGVRFSPSSYSFWARFRRTVNVFGSSGGSSVAASARIAWLISRAFPNCLV